MRFASTVLVLFVAISLPARLWGDETHEKGGGCDGPGCSVPSEGEKDAAPGPRLDLPGTSYGKGVTVKEPIAISKLIADSAKYDGKRVRVEGLVVDVCAKRGCWIRIASDEEFQTLFLKVEDGVMVFPVSAKGKYVVAEGTARRLPLSLEATKKMLADQAKAKGQPFDESKVTEPGFMVRLDGIGAVVRDKK